MKVIFDTIKDSQYDIYNNIKDNVLKKDEIETNNIYGNTPAYKYIKPYIDNIYIDLNDEISKKINVVNDKPKKQLNISISTFKDECKSKVKRKFIIGERYYLRGKSIEGSKQDIKEFEIKKIIYKINDKEVNSLVVKQISGINNSIFTLNKYDCKKLHIKYEPGLQVYSMELNWIKKNDNYK